MPHEIRLATWRYVDDSPQNGSDMPRSERRQEINVRPKSSGYPKGDAVVVDTEHDPDFHQALTQGVNSMIIDSERDSEQDIIKRSSSESGSAGKLNVPLSIVGHR